MIQKIKCWLGFHIPKVVKLKSPDMVRYFARCNYCSKYLSLPIIEKYATNKELEDMEDSLNIIKQFYGNDERAKKIASWLKEEIKAGKLRKD